MNEEYDPRIVKVTNISNFTFNGENGARFGGKDFLIEAGGSLVAPFVIADHLAKHLAQAMMLKTAPTRTEAEIGGKGSSAPLWDETRLNELKNKIMSGQYTEEKKEAVKSVEQKMVDKIKELNEKITDDSEENVNIPLEDVDEAGDVGYKDKAQVIAELKNRGITFDPRAAKATLEGLLK